MSIDSEHAITDECTVDLTNMIVKIPASYKDSNLTIRWYMPNASYQYCYDTDEKYKADRIYPSVRDVPDTPVS